MARFLQRSKLKNSINTQNQTDNELFIFGYSCKIFRDDDKALEIDRGRHLIPWMGDETLMIDRYDGRGHLHDLGPYEARGSGWDPKRDMSEEELRIEDVCDTERYLSLTSEQAEADLYHEEELKRLRVALASDGAYNEVRFSYDSTDGGQENESLEPTKDADENSDMASDEPFQVPEELNVSAEMTVPPTTKLNAIIERTALFVSQHGGQMEIVLKAKQAANPHFVFMNFDNALYPYYKHLIKMIKDGKYKPKDSAGNTSKTEVNEDDEDSDGDHYLHPSLFGGQSGSSSAPLPEPSIIVSRSMLRNENSLYSQLVKKLKPENNCNGPAPGCDQDYQSSPVDSYFDGSQTEPDAEAFAGRPLVDGQLERPDFDGYAKMLNVEPLTMFYHLPMQSTTAVPVKPQVATQGTSDVVIPTGDVADVIDKTASLVAKRGPTFEVSVMRKGHPKFDFLYSTHDYNAYYRRRVEHYEREIKAGNMPADTVPTRKVSSFLNDSASNSPTINYSADKPVSFSIKLKEPDAPVLEKRKALPSHEDDSDTEAPDRRAESSHRSRHDSKPKTERSRTTVTVEKQHGVKVSSGAASSSSSSRLPLNISSSTRAAIESAPVEPPAARVTSSRGVASSAASNIEMNKDEFMMLDRKQRAAMFMSLMKKVKAAKQEDQSVIGPQLPPHLRMLRQELDSAKSDSNPGQQAISNGNNHSSPMDTTTLASIQKKAEILPTLADLLLSRVASEPQAPPPKPVKRSRSRSHRRSSRSHSRERRMRRSGSRTRDRRGRGRADVPSAYAIIRRSLTPPPVRRKSRSHSTSRHRHTKSSRHRSRSRSRSRANKESRRRRSRSRSKSKRHATTSTSSKKHSKKDKKSRRERKEKKTKKSKKKRSDSVASGSSSSSGSSGRADSAAVNKRRLGSEAKRQKVVDLESAPEVVTLDDSK